MSEIENLSFEAAFAELEEVVRRLEEGNLPLDEAMALFERGTALAAHWAFSESVRAESSWKENGTTGALEYSQRDSAVQARHGGGFEKSFRSVPKTQRLIPAWQMN